MKVSVKAKDIAVIGIMSALLITVQIAMSFLPNIELISLLIILSTITFGWETLYIIYIFAFAEGAIFGFGTWWICYLYVWTILMLITMIFRKNRSPFFWAMVAGAFGLSFGALCSIPFLFIGGKAMALSDYIKGIPFDVIHCIGNYVSVLVLFKPLYKLFDRLKRKEFR